jgi:hypothetical protein
MTMDPIPDVDDHLAMSSRKEKAPSMLKSVALIITCSLAMIVNVSLPETVLDHDSNDTHGRHKIPHLSR